VGVRLVHLLSARLGVCEERLSDFVRKEVPARLAGLVLKLSEYQAVVTRDGERMIPTRYTHQQLGTMIGANREAVTRALGRLRREGAWRSGTATSTSRTPRPWSVSPNRGDEDQALARESLIASTVVFGAE
jgi:CRP-like cAMP-binding protein